MNRLLPIGLGLLALISTIALVCDCIALAVYISADPAVRTTSAISAVLQAIVWVMLSWFASTIVINSLASLLRRSSAKNLAVSFGCAILACVLAASITLANIIFLHDTKVAHHTQASKTPYIAASSVILAVAFASQVTFLAVHYLVSRQGASSGAESIYTNDDSRPSPKLHVKSIPYTRTRAFTAESRGMYSLESVNSVLDGKRSPIQVTTPRSSMSQSIRPSISKSRLVSIKEKQQLPSLDSRTRGDSVGSDSWDASSTHTAQDTSPPSHLRARFLETIPASPIIAEKPSLDSLSDLEPPAPIRERSRSYSPGGRKPRSLTQSPDVSTEELNIHPLFRSDSPTPPPAALPGTSIVASPDAGKVIHQRPSNQSLRRVRSSSLASANSPLSRRSSFEAPSIKKPVDEQGSIREVDEESEAEQDELTPPIPGFVMGAGNRSSLTRYNSKKQDSDDEDQS